MPVSDFLLASEEAVQTCTADEIYERFPIIYCKRIFPHKLETLEYLLVGTNPPAPPINPDESLQGVPDPNGSLARNFGEDGPWIYPVRLELTAALEALTPPQIDEVAQAWATTEAWQLDRGTPEDLRELLKDLSAFVRNRSRDEKLYVCFGL